MPDYKKDYTAFAALIEGNELSWYHKAVIKDLQNNPERQLSISLGRDAYKVDIKKTLQAMQNFVNQELIGKSFKHDEADVYLNPKLRPLRYTVERIKEDGKIICSFTGDGPKGRVEFDREHIDKLLIITQ